MRAEKDTHRPTCISDRCRKIKSFLKRNYCGESPFGNGPDDGCEITRIEKPQAHVNVLADYKCEWNATEHAAHCEQYGQLSPAVRETLIDELHHLGLPAEAEGHVYYTVWRLANANWSLAVAYYSHAIGDELELCEVITLIDDKSHAIVLRKLSFQKTDVDVPQVTQWAPVDIADAEGNGHDDVILEGNAYENHWFEVVRVHNGIMSTIFSGLGYYL